MDGFIEILSPSALKDLTTANNEVVKLISNINSAGQAMQSIKTPSGSDSAVKNLSNNLIAQEKNIQKVQQALEKARIEEIKLQQAREKAFDKYDAQLAKEQAKLNASLGVYSKVQQKLNTLNNEYRNLAVKKELSGKLTDAEAKRYDYLSSRITKYDTTLKAVDASMGKYQRNVGNYAGAFNPLSNSINQLSREMPAFANSVQTGFMAISNNLPIFFDAMGQAIAQQKELQAQGKPSQNALQLLAGSFFTLGTVLSVGVTLLTFYGKDIVEWASNVIKGSKSIDTLKESQKQLNEVSQQGAKNAVEETTKLKSLLEIAKDTSLSYKERVIAVNELQSTYPAYFGNLKEEQILAGQTAEAERQLTDAILSRAKANAAIEKITENQSAIIDLELERLQIIKELDNAQQNYNNRLKIYEETKDPSVNTALAQSERTLISSKKDLANIDRELADLNKINTTLTNFAIEKEKESILLKYKSKDATKSNAEAKREDVEAIKMQTESTNTFLQKLISLRDAFAKQRDTMTEGREQWQELNKVVAGYQNLIDAIKETGDPLKDSALKSTDEFLKRYKKNTKETLDETKSYWKEHGREIIDLSQDLINTLAEISNQRFENQLSDLEKEKNTAILFAGESVTAREEIERQAEIRKKAILDRQASAQKKLAMFNIITDTAQAVVASLIRDPSGTLAIIIGAIGAANLALVASQQVPQFADGGVHEGGLMMVNDQKGSKYKEIIETPDGKKRIFNERNKVLNAPKGTKIYNATETESILFNNELNGILTNNGISNAPTVIVDGGLSKEDFNNGISKLAKTINEKETFSFVEDKRGRKIYKEKQRKRTELLNVILKAGRYDV